MPHADDSLTRGGSTFVRGRVRSPNMAKLQAASMPIAYGSCTRTAAAPPRHSSGAKAEWDLFNMYGELRAAGGGAR